MKTSALALGSSPAAAAAVSVRTLIGTETPGFSSQQANNPYGLAFGPDQALYFCDLDNQRIRRLDPQNTWLSRSVIRAGESA